MEGYGEIACKPWDVVLPADVITTLSDNLVALAMGQISPEDFAKTMDESLAQNVSK